MNYPIKICNDNQTETITIDKLTVDELKNKIPNFGTIEKLFFLKLLDKDDVLIETDEDLSDSYECRPSDGLYIIKMIKTAKKIVNDVEPEPGSQLKTKIEGTLNNQDDEKAKDSSCDVSTPLDNENNNDDDNKITEICPLPTDITQNNKDTQQFDTADTQDKHHTTDDQNMTYVSKNVYLLIIPVLIIILAYLVNEFYINRKPEVIIDSDLFKCPNINSIYIPIQQTISKNKIISAIDNNHPTNTMYQWNIDENDINCNFKVKRKHNHTFEIIDFNDCNPFNLNLTLFMNSSVSDYFIHSKECNFELIFHYMFECPNIENPLHIPLQTTNKLISIKYFNNSEYKWDINQYDIDENECNYNTRGLNTNKLLLFDFNDCQPFKLNITLLLKSVNYFIECNNNLIFYDEPVFGIDLGTTYSCISYQKNIFNKDDRRDTIIIRSDLRSNRYCIPSAVYFTYDSRNNPLILIGQDAMNKLKDDPFNVIYDIKRVIGRAASDIEFKSFTDNHIFNVSHNNRSVFIPNWNDSEILFEQILSIILTHLVEIASKEWYYDKDNINYNPLKYNPNVVVSVPALFHNGQRKGIRSACHLSGLNPIKLIIEPSGASLAYSYYNRVPNDNLKLFLAFDFGGGTLDCSVMRCVGVECSVLSVHGNSALGGRDFDNVIRDIIINKYKQQHKWINISDEMYSKILQISEQVKIDLTKLTEYSLTLTNNNGVPKTIIITKDEFEQDNKTQKLVQLAVDAANTAITLANFQWTNVKMILMIGGSSKIPVIQKALINEFGKNNENILVFSDDIDTQLMVVTGCGIIGGSLAYPYTYTSSRDVVLHNVIPLSIGFKISQVNDIGDIEHGIMKKILNKNTLYPTQETEEICQEKANKNKLKLKLYQGDDKYTKNNYFLGEITINNISIRHPDDCDNVLLTFIVDDNGVFTVEAKTNKKYGPVTKYNITIASENSKHGTLKHDYTVKLRKQMISWYNRKLYPLIRKAFSLD